MDENALKLTAGQLASQVCDRMTSIGLVWVVTERFGAQWVPWYLAVVGLPHLLLSTVSGRWVHCWGELRTVVRADFLRAGLFAVAALLSLRIGIEHWLGALFGLVFVTNLAAALFNPALLSLPIRIAEGEGVQRLTALLNSCFSASSILGPLAAVGLYKAGGLPLIFGVTAAAYGLAGALSASIRIETTGENEMAERSVSPGILETLRSDPLITSMLAAFLLMNLLLGPLQLGLPAYAKDIYRGDIDSLAWLEGALGAGMLLGSLALTVIKLPGARLQRVHGCLIGGAFAYLAFSLSRSIVSGCAATFTLGVLLGVTNVVLLGFFQERPSADRVPVIMGLVNLIGVASLPFSMSLAGMVLPYTGISTLLLSCAGALIAITFGTALRIGVREA